MHENFDFDSITFKDNYLFQSIMKEKDICKDVLELLLGFKLKRITYPEQEKSVAGDLGSHSVRFDVYVENEGGDVFDIEMQNVDEGDLEKRSLYYQAMLYSSMLEKGAKGYKDLKKTYVIFLCDFNPCDGKKMVYRFQARDEGSDPYTLDDGAIRIFACTKGTRASTPVAIKNLLLYLNDGKPRDELTNRIDSETVRRKTNAKWRRSYMENHATEWDLLDRGEAKGEAKAFASMSKLAEALRKDGRSDLLEEAIADEGLREKLFKEYGIR